MILVKITCVALAREGMVKTVREEGKPGVMKVCKVLRPVVSKIGLLVGRVLVPRRSGGVGCVVKPAVALVLSLVV